MKIRVLFKDGHEEESEHINALYASRYVDSLQNVETYDIVNKLFDIEEYNKTHDY